MATEVERPALQDAAMLADAIRRTVVQESNRANVGHIGSSLSVADIVAAVYGGVLAPLDMSDDRDRDRFILSKGHAALSLYAALALTGRIDSELLSTFCTDGSALAAHPEHGVPGVEFCTGSLGHGLAIAAGAALAARMQRSSRRIFVLLSDAECNEGSVWETATFAAHHRLANLVAIVDLNGQQGFGYTDEVLSMSPLVDRWHAFAWDAREVDGHDVVGLVEVINGLRGGDAPHVLIAHTTFGRGVSFMEGQLRWHYAPMNDSEYLAAISELAGQPQ